MLGSSLIQISVDRNEQGKKLLKELCVQDVTNCMCVGFDNEHCKKCISLLCAYKAHRTHGKYVPLDFCKTRDMHIDFVWSC